MPARTNARNTLIPTLSLALIGGLVLALAAVGVADSPPESEVAVARSDNDGGGGQGLGGLKPPAGTDNIADDVRIMLLRSYVPADGRMAIDADLPVVTMVMRDDASGDLERFALNTCPFRITSARVFSDLFDRKADSTEAHFDRMARQIGADLGKRSRTPFPYCGWWARINTSVYSTRDYDRSSVPVQDGMNIFLPDSDATYWAIPFDASQEPNRHGLILDHVEIQGKFQEQLFMSYVVYDSNMDFYYYDNGTTLCQSYNTDYQIEPDPGGTNPWQEVSAAYEDTYTLQLEFDPQGTECSGGGPGAHKTAGDNFNVLPLSRTGSGYGPTSSSPNPIHGEFFGETVGGSIPRASNGCAYVGDGSLTPCATPHMFAAPTEAAQGSVWSNPVAGYLASGWVPEPGYVYVYRGKAPRTPQGSSPVPWSDGDVADYDMRYFSLCVDKKVWPFPAQDANWSCANGSFGSGEYDEATNPDGLTQLAIGADGYWTVIVTTSDDLPAQQVAGATVLRVDPFTPVAFIMRHMVVQDGFTTSVPFIERDGAWTTAFAQLGEYYPVETVVCDEAQFIARGWTDGGCFVPSVSGN